MFNRVEYIIKIIKEMSIMDRLRVGIAMFSSSFIDTSYNKKELFEKYDNQLKKIDNTYIMSFSGIYNHTVVMFVVSKIIEFTKEEQNMVAMYLVNSI